MVDDVLPEIRVHPGDLDARALRKFDTDDVLALAVLPDSAGAVVAGGQGLSVRYGFDLTALARRAGAKDTAGGTTAVALPQPERKPPWSGLPDRFLFVGVGDRSTKSLRRAGAGVARASAEGEHVLAAFAAVLDADAEAAVADPAAGAAAFAEGVWLASYRPPFTGAGAGPEAPLQRVTIAADLDDDVIETARIGAQATLFARMLAATPSNTKSPAWLAEQATRGAKGIKGVSVQVHDEKWLAARGMNGILAVGSGSSTPPRMVVVSYTPTARRRSAAGPVVLVGKGITYDTGGLSLKPREAMMPMKTDMSGAAAVLAAVLGAAQAKVPTAVVGVLPLAENAFGEGSYRPGDVLQMVDGTTVEIRNTDAEGRLVLADAMAWACREFSPQALVDVATLTGAATLGLGKGHGALYATTTELTETLQAAGAATGEPLWPMPLVADYEHALDSDVADLCHISTDSHTSGGSITAALFLRHFAADVPWAHLDIAGPGRAAKTQHEITEGPTGFSARALVHWLGEYAPSH